MDSTPTPTPTRTLLQSQRSPLLYPPPPQPSSATKLPIKRKNPDSIIPNPNPLSPQLHSDFNDVVVPIPVDSYAQTLSTARTPPFKYHRVWTEPDELLFLQDLLDCASHGGFSFPKDLHLFYARFSATVSHSYTKAQLSEKLRRLRKKFRVVSSRLARGGSQSQLSPHDRALYELSKKLWSPECWSTSPFGNKPNSYAAGEFDNFAAADENLNENQNQGVSDAVDVENDYGDEVKTSELARPIAGLAAKTVLDVFDQSLNEVRMVLAQQGLLCFDPVGSGSGSGSSSVRRTAMDFERQWQLQRLAELDVLAQRLRLVLNDSIRWQ